MRSLRYMNVSVVTHARDRPDPLRDQLEQLLVALADHLDEHVEGAGGDDDVVDLVHRGERVRDRLERRRRRGSPIIAWRANPSSSGSVTATTCMTPLSTSRWTRCRTAASDSPTTLPIAAYDRRPSCWSCSMIAFETSSSTAADRWTRWRRGCSRG